MLFLEEEVFYKWNPIFCAFQEFDAGEYFLLTRAEESDNSLKVVVAKEEGMKVSDSNAVFLIDHAWTYRAAEARKQLCEIPGCWLQLFEITRLSTLLFVQAIVVRFVLTHKV